MDLNNSQIDSTHYTNDKAVIILDFQ